MQFEFQVRSRKIARCLEGYSSNQDKSMIEIPQKRRHYAPTPPPFATKLYTVISWFLILSTGFGPGITEQLAHAAGDDSDSYAKTYNPNGSNDNTEERFKRRKIPRFRHD